jgi:hypothetical protein
MKIINDVCPTCGRRKPRSVQQNSRYWSLLTLAAEKLGYDKNIWHEYMRGKFLPSNIVNMNGEERLINYPTHDLPMHPDIDNPDKPNWETYTLQVESFLAENGVYLPE